MWLGCCKASKSTSQHSPLGEITLQFNFNSLRLIERLFILPYSSAIVKCFSKLGGFSVFFSYVCLCFLMFFIMKKLFMLLASIRIKFDATAFIKCIYGQLCFSSQNISVRPVFEIYTSSIITYSISRIRFCFYRCPPILPNQWEQPVFDTFLVI